MQARERRYQKREATRSKKYLLKLMNLRGLQNHQSQTPNQEPLQVLSQHYFSRLHQCSLTCTNHFRSRVRLIHSISESLSYVVTSVCAMAASSTTFRLLTQPAICSLCIESGGCSTCQETLFHSLGSAMPTTICILYISSLYGLSSPQSHLVITQNVRDSLQQEHKEAKCLAFAIIIFYWNMSMFTIRIPHNTSCYNTMYSIDQLFM